VAKAVTVATVAKAVTVAAETPIKSNN